MLNNVNQVTPYGNLTYTQNGGGKKYDDASYQKAMDAYNKQVSATQATGNSGSIAFKGLNGMPGVFSSAGKPPAAPVAPKYSDFLTGDSPPQFTSTVNLSPDQQKLLDLSSQGDIGTAKLGLDQLGRISNAVSSPYSYSGLGDAPTADSMAQSQDKGQQAVLSRLLPQQQHDEAALQTRLSNQGIQQGSEAYNDAYRQFNNAKTDAQQQAVLAGQQYATAGQQDAMARRQQAITEYGAQRNAPLNEYSALTSGSQVQNPQFQNSGYTGAQPADLAGNIYKNYQGALNQYSNQVASNNANSGGLFNLGGSLGAAWIASDARLKSNIKKIGNLKNGLNVYSYNYLGDDSMHIGVIAQEVTPVIPAAVTMKNGYYAVNYGMIFNG